MLGAQRVADAGLPIRAHRSRSFSGMFGLICRTYLRLVINYNAAGLLRPRFRNSDE